MAEDIDKLFTQPGSCIIVVCFVSAQAPLTSSEGNCHSNGIKYTEGWKND